MKSRGCENGKNEQDWLRAEQEILINIDREIQPHDAQQIGANCRVQPWRPNSQAETGNSKLHQGAVVLQPD